MKERERVDKMDRMNITQVKIKMMWRAQGSLFYFFQ